MKSVMKYGIALHFLALPALSYASGQPDDLSAESWLLIFMIVLALILLAVALLLNKAVLILREKALPETVATIREVQPARRSFWERFWDLKPRFTEASETSEHVYDGIYELDNPTPPWFMYLFYSTIVFGGIYLYRYHFSDTDRLQLAEYKAELQAGEIQRETWARQMANSIDETNVAMITEQAALESGKKTFAQFCATCHGKQAEGQAGPNLTDAYWLHGGNIKSVFRTVKYGVPEKGMVSWEKRLSPQQIQEVASYVLSLQGSNPANAKEPQGVLETALPAGDSASVSIK